MNAPTVRGHDGDGDAIPEHLPTSPESAAPLGYAQAKWVAEHMCARASQFQSQKGRKNLTGLPEPKNQTQTDLHAHDRIAIARVGQLCGDTVHGVWNESEGWPLLIASASARRVGCLPKIDEVRQ